MDLLRRERAFVEAGQNEFQLARIGVDVADGEDSGRRGLEFLGVGRHEVLVQVQAPVGDGAELHRQTEEGHHALAGDVARRAVVELDGGGRHFAVLAGDRADLADDQIHFLFAHEFAHGIDRMRRAAEIVAAMHERDALGNWMQVQRPVERAVAAAHDHHVLVAEVFHAPHGIMDGLAFIGVDARDRRLLRLKRAAAGRHDHALALERLAGVGPHPERGLVRRSGGLQRRHHLAEMVGRVEGFDLLDEIVDQALAGDDGKARNVVDRLFRIKLGALAAGARQDVHEMGADIEQAQLEHGEQAGRTGADDDNVGSDRFAHRISPVGFSRISPACRGC